MRKIEDCFALVASSDHDFSCRQIVILLRCGCTESAFDRQIHTLARELGYSRPVVSRAAQKLIGASYIERAELPGDRRTCVLSVTREGHRFIQTILGEPETRSPKRRREKAHAST